MNARDGMKRLRDERRERGICTMCGLTKPEHGHKICRECLDRSKAYSAKWRASHPDKVRERTRKHNALAKTIRVERKANRICVICGKNKPRGWKVTCESCLEKRRLSELKRTMKKEG